MRRHLVVAAMRTMLLSTLCLCTALSAGCDSSTDAAKPAAKTSAKNAQPAPKASTVDTPDAAKAPAAAPAAKPAPKLEPLALEAWGLTMQVPAGTKLGELEDNTLTIDAEAGCGAEIELYRHDKSADGVAQMFKNATGPSGNPNDVFPIKEQRDDGYRVKRSWEPPLGKVWATEVGVVLGDHLLLCGTGSMFGVEEHQADCAMKACETLALTAG